MHEQTKQKPLLKAADHEVQAYNLLREAWTIENLRWFFEDRLVFEWFNRSAPRVKSGEVVPEQVDAQIALALMVSDPLLICCPLLQVGDRTEVGFECRTDRGWDWLDGCGRVAGEHYHKIKSDQPKSANLSAQPPRITNFCKYQ